LLAYSSGILLATFVPTLASAMPLALASLCVLLLANCLAWRWQKQGDCLPVCLPCLRLALAASIGFVWHLLWACNIWQQRLPFELEGQDMWVSGVVANLPVRNLNASQFQFEIIHSEFDFAPRRILLNFYGATEIKAGQVWRLRVRLNRPHGFANPGGFDYEAWLFQQGITAKGYVRQDANNQLLGIRSASCPPLVRRFVSASWLRQRHCRI